MDSIWEQFLDTLLFGHGFLLSPLYVLSFIAIAWCIYRARRESIGFFAWLAPKSIWMHRSTRLDLMLLVMGQVMLYLGLFARFAAMPLVAAWVAARVPYTPIDEKGVSPVVLALAFLLIADFAVYWNHRMHHTIKVIWPIHAVHHSAEVMTPLTAYRQHPLSSAIGIAFQTFVVGGILGLLVGALDPTTTFWEIAGVNAFVLVLNLTLSNFHHSHIWVSFGPVFERLIISPAQHQVHHSTNPEHFNKNFGQSFALWDWLFGTLYVTKSNECVTFGLNDKADASLMTHRLWPILWDPVRRVAFMAVGRRED